MQGQGHHAIDRVERGRGRGERERTPKLYFTRRGGERVGEERERGGEGGRGA